MDYQCFCLCLQDYVSVLSLCHFGPIHYLRSFFCLTIIIYVCRDVSWIKFMINGDSAAFVYPLCIHSMVSYAFEGLFLLNTYFNCKGKVSVNKRIDRKWFSFIYAGANEDVIHADLRCVRPLPIESSPTTIKVPCNYC